MNVKVSTKKAATLADVKPGDFYIIHHPEHNERVRFCISVGYSELQQKRLLGWIYMDGSPLIGEVFHFDKNKRAAEPDLPVQIFTGVSLELEEKKE